MTEVEVSSTLKMDRSEALGNSEDVFLRRALHVKIGNDASEAIPVFFGYPGVSHFLTSGRVSTTPGVEQVLISETVPTGKTIRILQVNTTCRIEGVYSVYIGTSLVGSGRTGSGDLNSFFSWVPFIDAVAGESVVIKFQAMGGRPASDVETYLQARLI